MENEPPIESGRRRDRLMGKLFGQSALLRDRKLTNEESANEISEFLGTSDRLLISHPPPKPPPFQNAGPPSLALDTSKASRYPKASDVDGATRTHSHSPPRPRKKGRTVRFADTYPEIIGEGGDECEAAVAEIGKRKRSKSVPAPIPRTREGHEYARQVGAYQETRKGDDGFVPGPIRRSQTDLASMAADGQAPVRTPPEPPKPRAIPTGEATRSRFLDINPNKDENRRSFIEIQQQEQRLAEGRVLAEAVRSASFGSRNDWDEPSSSPESVRGTPPRRRELARAEESTPISSLARAQSGRSPPSLEQSVASLLRTESTRSPMGARSPLSTSSSQSATVMNPLTKSPLPPPSQDESPKRTPLSRSPLPPIPTQDLVPEFNSDQTMSQAPMSPSELRVLTNFNDGSPSSTYSGRSNSDLLQKQTPVTQAPGTRDFFTSSSSSPEKMSRNPHEAVATPEDDSLEIFNLRTKHLYELFRLYAEQLKPLDTSRPEDLCRAALWWFLRGRKGLELAIRNRPANPEDTQHLIARYQAYTDLAKSWWLTEQALPGIAEGKFSPEDGELGEVRQTLASNLRKLSGSMKRNGFLPPEEPFLPQTMDKSIWIEYPALSQDIIALLNGVWGSSLAAVKQPTRTMGALEALPIGDTAKNFNYSRITALVGLTEQGEDSTRLYFPCVLSVVRPQTDPNLNFVIASQNGSISLRIQTDKNAGPSWKDVRWRPEASSIEVKMPRGFMLEVECSQQDYRMLWSIYDFANKVQSYLYPRKDEVVTHSITLRGFHYFDSNPQGRNFPKDAVGQCQLGLFEKLLKENSPTGPRTFHRGFRLAVVTGPRIRTLSGVSHVFPPQLPVQFALLRGDQRSPLLQLDFNDGKEKGRMVLSFNDDKEREKMLRLISGTYVRFDEEVIAEVPLEGMNMTEGFTDSKNGLAAIQRLPWQRARVINEKSLDAPPTVLAEKLRVEVDSMDKSGVGVVSTLADRINVAPGELRLRLGTRDILTLQVLRQPQQDLTTSVLETLVPRETAREFASLQGTVQRSQTVRTYRFPSFKDLHAFQAGITGYKVLFDGIASSLNISRRRMVVPIHKKWEAGTTRVQVVQQEKTVQMLAFFEDWHHGQCMGFVLKGTDVFESFSRNGKAGLKLADAKFPLPKVPAEGDPKSDEAAFLCLDMPEFAGEHDDITIIFDDKLDRDQLCSVLPAPVKGARISKSK
ncbi:hypothetical protein F4809DRAFT_284906 [Biscogniauxia mediterranea]|nr:hypothetical protein F4809DRAFT_284906 [Biscogniauxia mediterranea]